MMRQVAPGRQVTLGGVELQAGEHDLRVEHFEIDGYAQLQLTLEPR